MQLRKIEIKNFRLLRDIELNFDAKTTVIVGRNNSGKTSLTEFFDRLLGDNAPCFEIEDFSIGAHENFWEAYQLLGKEDDRAIRATIPSIRASISISYDKAGEDVALLSDFIVDLNPDCVEVLLNIRYEVPPGQIKAFFEDIVIPKGKTLDAEREAFFRAMRDRIPKLFKASLLAVDPGDATNTKKVEWRRLRSLIQGGFVEAQRGLDDATITPTEVLGKILSVLFRNAKAESAAATDKATAKKLEAAVEGVQSEIDRSFSEQLKELLPTIQLFGYPGLPDPKLRTETVLGVERLLKDHTKIRYSGINGVHLPEAYNGLGARNLIYILFKLLEFFKAFQSSETAVGVHVIFVEEPEAHLHPQMQEVFIRKLTEIATQFSATYNEGKPWPVQFVVTTHSPHVANKASFRSMRYFLAIADGSTGHCQTRIKDLGNGFNTSLKEDEDFLHQYMTLTRCDLLFADKAILIEGTAERILLPRMIIKVDQRNGSTKPSLGTQYVSAVEVDGAYAHRFFKLLEFLELRALIITDIDSVKLNPVSKRYEACRMSEGTHSSNGCINEWFATDEARPLLSVIVSKSPADKTKGNRHLAYQVPHEVGAITGDPQKDALLKAHPRSFEDAFLLANADLFSIDLRNGDLAELDAYEQAEDLEKTEFALKYGIEISEWSVPRYLYEGLSWLA
jgi:predicted ATP-dependent endonuclease of OLD family